MRQVSGHQGEPSNSYSFILRKSLTVLMFRAVTACRWFPLYRSSARWMSSRSCARRLTVLPAIDASFRWEIPGRQLAHGAARPESRSAVRETGWSFVWLEIQQLGELELL